MTRRMRKSGMWEYLDSTGVLERGIDEEIKEAKRTYRKQYFLKHKRQQRQNKPEFTVTFSKENGQLERVTLASKRHKRTITAFIRLATLAYIDKTFVVPNAYQVAQLEQILSNCLNEIKTIVRSKEKYFWEGEQRLEQIEKRIIHLEGQINEVFRNPPILIPDDHKNQIA